MQNFSQEGLAQMSVKDLHALRDDCMTLLTRMKVVDSYLPELLAKIEKALAQK